MTFHQDIGFQPAPPSGFAAMTPGQTVDMAQHLREIQGQNALGAAYQQAIDPVTGRIDQAKLGNALAGSNAPWMVGPAGIQAGQSMEAQGRGTSAQLDAQRQQIQIFNAALAGLDPSVPHYAPELQQHLDALNKAGYVTPAGYAQAQQMLSTLHPGEDARPMIKSMQYLGQSAEEFANRQMGPTVGQQAQILQFLNTPIQGGWTDETTGQNVQGTMAQFMIAHHQNPANVYPGVVIDSQGHAIGGGGGGGGAGGGAGDQSIKTVTTGQTSTGAGGTSGGGTSGGAGGGADTGSTAFGRPATLPPADVLAANRGQFLKDQAVQSTLGDRTFALEQALNVLHRNPNLQTVGHDELYQLQKVADSFGLNIDVTNAKDYDVLAKTLKQYLQYAPNANASDLARVQTEASNAHIGQARPAMQELLVKAIGLERMRSIGYDYFVGQHQGDVNAAQNESSLYGNALNWRGKLDPMALAADHMTSDEQRAYFDSLPGSVNASKTAGSGAKWRYIQSRLAVLKVHPEWTVGANAYTPPPGQ